VVDNGSMPPRIFHSGPLAEAAQAELTGPAAAHLGKVLRLRANDELVLFNGDGLDYQARIISVGRHDVTVSIQGSQAVRTESPIAVTLLQGICRNHRMDLLIQKSTELGVQRIQPVLCERSVVKIDADRAEKKLSHWRGVAISACEQCGRARIPEIEPPRSIEEAINALDASAARLMLDPNGTDSMADAIDSSRTLAMIIGPEGGLTEPERQQVSAAGFRRVRLGPRTLRTETAPIAALGIIQYLAGDLSGT
jgi:16S rRNA (uracil1498-N3)-methyltransferase